MQDNHIPGVDNRQADALSRDKFSSFNVEQSSVK